MSATVPEKLRKTPFLNRYLAIFVLCKFRLMRYVTIKDIAKALGISKSTVSRALASDVRNVSEKTIREVVEMAEKLGYTKNETAVNLRNRSTRTVGIIIPEGISSFNLQFAIQTQRLLQRHGYRLIIALADEDFLTERSSFEVFESYRVDGVMISPCNYKANLEFYRKALNRNLPIVFFDRTIPELECSSVRSDDYSSSFFLIEHLIYKGHRRILHLAGPDYIYNSHERLRAYKDVLKKHKIEYDPELVINAGVNEKAAAEAMTRILDSGISCDGVFCFTELQALGAKKVLQERKIRIPEDIALTTMSGTQLSTLVYPAITAVEQNLERMASETVRLLLTKIDNPMSPAEDVVIPAGTVIRASS